MYHNTRRIQCLNIHAEEIGKLLPSKTRETESTDVYTTFIFDKDVPIYIHKVSKANKPMIIIDGSTLLYKFFWTREDSCSLSISKPKVNIVIFNCDAFWLKQLEIHNLRQFLKMTG